MQATPICTKCAHPIKDTYYFCPRCGKVLTPVLLSTSFLKQLGIYTASFCFAPLGLKWVWQYLHQPTAKAKMVGVIALILTFVSISLTIITFKKISEKYTEVLNNATYKNFQY